MGPVGMVRVFIGSQRLRYEARHPMEETALSGMTPVPENGTRSKSFGEPFFDDGEEWSMMQPKVCWRMENLSPVKSFTVKL